MTYSILGRDQDTGEMGIAVQSHFFGAGRIVPWAEAGVGAVITQSIPEASYGPLGLALMRSGVSATEALRQLVAKDPGAVARQVAMIDATGDVAVHTGEGCVKECGHAIGDQVSAHANLVASPTVWPAMVRAFETSKGQPIHDRILAALEAAEGEGGDMRGKQSAAMLVVSGERTEAPWDHRIIDVRVDDHPDPLTELRRLVEHSRAFDSLYSVFTSGILFAPLDADAPELARALTALEATQRVYGENREPTFWHGVLLAKVGRIDEARELFRAACETHPGWLQLIDRLGPAGVLPNDEELITRLRP